MSGNFQTEIYLACWGAAAGGFVSMVLYFLQPLIKRWYLTNQIKVYAEEFHGNQKRCRVCNEGYWTITQAIIYIALDYDRNKDVLVPPEGEDAFINPTHRIPLRGDQLCWSVRSPTVNPIKVDIFAKERQPFSLCDIRSDCIMIPSEEGWEDPKNKFPPEDRPRKARVFLRRKNEPYTGFLKIVSAETNACFFRIAIDPNNESQPLEIEPVCAMDLPYKF
ncbi:MAG TPA: hypothetical protein VIK53_06830 [Verrucomicrobiae bacterium]